MGVVGVTVAGLVLLAGLACVGFATLRWRSPALPLAGLLVALADLENGVLIADEDRRLIYANRKAGTVFGRSVDELPGRPVGDLIDGIDLDAPDGTGEFSRAGRTYEFRCSGITDRRGRSVGHAIVLTDVTERKRRERRLRRQRDELAVLDGLNDVVREIDDLLAESPTREDVEARTCERLVDSGLYADAWIERGVVADGGESTWTTGDRTGRTEGDDGSEGVPDGVVAFVEDRGAEAASVDAGVAGDDGVPVGEDRPGPGVGERASVPIVHGRVVYGLVIVRADRPEAFGERERDGLAALGERLGHAIDAIENRALLVGDGYLELELECTDDRSALVALAGLEGCRGRLAGFVPRSEGEFVAYAPLGNGEGDANGDSPVGEAVEVDAAADPSGTPGVDPSAGTSGADAVAEVAADLPGIVAARTVGDRLLEVVLAEGSLAAPIVDSGARVRTIDLGDDGCRVTVEAAPGADVRSLVEAVRETYPDTRLRRKTRRDRFPDDVALPTALETLTDRQREALEVAYRAGYFEWPRESTGEDVAAALSISPPTLHAHLRKAQNALVAGLFEDR